MPPWPIIDEAVAFDGNRPATTCDSGDQRPARGDDAGRGRKIQKLLTTRLSE
jgi:hypothetical protein